MSSNITSPKRKMTALRIGQRLTQLRGTRSQTEISEAAGMDQSQLSRYERGRAIPSEEVLERLAKALGHSVEEITCAIEEGIAQAREKPNSAAVEVANRLNKLWGGLSLKYLSQVTKIPIKYLSLLANGEIVPTQWMVDRLAYELACSPEDILGDIVPPQSVLEWDNILETSILIDELYDNANAKPSQNSIEFNFNTIDIISEVSGLLMDFLFKIELKYSVLMGDLRLLALENIELKALINELKTNKPDQGKKLNNK